MSSNSRPDQPQPDPDRTTPAPASGQPWSTPSGDPLAADPYRPSPTFSPGYASLPQPPDPDYPPTSEFPATTSDNVPPGYPPPGYGTPYDPHSAGGGGRGGYGGATGGGGGAYDGGAGGGGGAYDGGAGYTADPGGYPPPARPPRKSSVPIVAVIIAVTLLLCGGVATAGVLIARNVTQTAKDAVPPLPTIKPEVPAVPTEGPAFGAKVTVTYEVTGDGPASQLLYVESLSESPQRLQSVKLPWKFTGEIDTPTVLNVTAFRLGDPDGTISCRVLVNGEEVARNTSDPGTFGTVTCNHFAFE
ncbi:MmpS family transport accessory protein [Actinoplanes sp. NPDC000266]